MADTFAALRAKYNIEYIALGWEACESLARACMLKTFDNGICLSHQIECLMPENRRDLAGKGGIYWE